MKILILYILYISVVRILVDCCNACNVILDCSVVSKVDCVVSADINSSLVGTVKNESAELSLVNVEHVVCVDCAVAVNVTEDDYLVDCKVADSRDALMSLTSVSTSEIIEASVDSITTLHMKLLIAASSLSAQASTLVLFFVESTLS